MRNYQFMKLVSYLENEEVPANSNNIFLIAKREPANLDSFQKSVISKIDKAFLDNEAAVIASHGDTLNVVVIAPNREIEFLRLAGALLSAALKKQQLKSVILNGLEELTEEEGYAFLEGMLLSSYQFNKYKTKEEISPVTVHVQDRQLSKHKVEELMLVTESVSLTKTMVNEPPNFMDALKFSELAIETGKRYGFETEILHKKEIQALKMGGVLAVNKGSATPPTFNVFHYKPENAINSKPLVLVGKGIMFDTGGYSLKTGGSMTTMKSDMAGGAAVLGVLSAIASNQLPYHVIGIVPATDNKISSDALVVDDIITMMDGTTVEVQNTDAEGRLVLADALTYAKRFEPELVIDIATLTGASAAITGPFGIATLGNDQHKMDELKETGEHVYERLVQLPLWDEYASLLKSDIADFKNIGGPTGGVSTSGKFLEHFTNYPWIHLDIAGASFVKEAKGYRQSGATGVAVRLIYAFIKKRVGQKS